MGNVVWCRLQHKPLNEAELLDAVRNIRFGGISLFSGDVRAETGGQVTKKLHYEAYEDMALKQMEAMAQEAADRWDANVAVAHRLGEILPGETAVVCVAACAHRAEAFECCRFLIDKIKEDVPIWKREG